MRQIVGGGRYPRLRGGYCMVPCVEMVPVDYGSAGPVSMDGNGHEKFDAVVYYVAWFQRISRKDRLLHGLDDIRTLGRFVILELVD